MKDHHKGPFSLEGFVACFDLPTAVDLYAEALDQARKYGAKEQALLEVEISRPSEAAFSIRLFSSTAPKVDIWSTGSQ